MSEMLLKHFDLLATAPDAVARLRELILTLAMQGKLLPQDPKDEPASVLLQRIRAEKVQLVAEGKIKRDKPLSPITDEEKPFELPSGWEWVRLGNLLPFRIGRTPPSKEAQYWTDYGYPWVSIADMEHLGVVQQTGRTLTERGAAQFGYEPLPAGTLLMSFKLTIGKIAVLGVPAYHNEAIASFHPLTGLDTEFLKFVLPSVAKTGASKNALMGQTLNTESLSNLILAIPPTGEQSRIVARVEELMRLCDALEAKRQLDSTQHTQLLQTLLSTLSDSATPEELAANWQRVATHFDLLLDRSEAVDALEQTILQLAVRGLLVPQDPSDEPANVLLQRIRTEKDRLIAEGKIKRDKLLPPIADEEKPFVLPQGWEWVRVATVFDTTSGSSFDLGMEKESGAYMYVKVGDMNLPGNEFEITTSSRFIDPDEKTEKTLIPSGSIIFPKRGGAIATNKKRVVGEPLFVDLNTMAITPVLMRTEYAFLWLMTIDLASLNTGTSVPQINHKDIDPLPFPLPPLPEQSRIVARVEELRRLCADLRQRLTASHTTQGHLAEALVEDIAA